MDKITVIIPVYNSEKYLNACIDSVLAQTYQNFEVILVDDGSTDRSGEICDEYCEHDQRIRVIHKTNEGVSAARNEGLSCASGDWISFIDSDDTMEPDMYELLLNTAKKYGAEISHCGYKRISEQGEMLKEVSGTHTILVQGSEEAVTCMLEGHYFVGGLWNKLYSRRCIENLTFQTELKNNEDILFNAMAFQEASKIAFADETKYCYWEHSSSACNQMEAERQCRDAASAAEIMCARSKSAEMRAISEKWRLATKSSLYRCMLLRGNKRDIESVELRQWLKENGKTAHAGFRARLNSAFMLNCPDLYNILYRCYDSLRKPNWDLK